jgi:DNA-binding NarL/FixJ family response regulator
MRRSKRLRNPLTARELQVLAAYALTGSQELAAADLGITVQTLKNHLSAIYRATQSRSGIQAVWKVYVTEEYADD